MQRSDPLDFFSTLTRMIRQLVVEIAFHRYRHWNHQNRPRFVRRRIHGLVIRLRFVVWDHAILSCRRTRLLK